MKNKIKLNQLTGLRYFAALLVFASHTSWNNSHEFFMRFFQQGYVGVSFFFILSGFVLSYSYKEKIKNQSLEFKKYALLRLARLTPLHLLTALPFIFYAFFTDQNYTIIKTIFNLSYLQSWIPISSFYFSLNAPSWSLSNEMFFYLCFFPLAMFSFRRVVFLTLALSAVVFISAMIVYCFMDGRVFVGGYTFAHWLFYIFPGFRLLEFLTGMLLFEIWKSGYRLNIVSMPFAYIFLAVAMWFAIDIPESFRLSLYYLPFIAFFLYTHLTDDSLVNKFYSSKSMILLGNASFAFYLIHQPIISILKWLLNSIEISDFYFFITSLLLTTLASVMTYLIYERRAEGYLKKLINNSSFFKPREFSETEHNVGVRPL